MIAVSLNEGIAAQLEEVAGILAEQGANRFRMGAYRGAATTLRNLDEPVADLLERAGREGLVRLPGIGQTLARAIEATILTGGLPMLDRLRGETDPVSLIASVPGIGQVLAERLHRDLGLDTLEDLETAAHDGRLARMAGFGSKRIAGIRDSLATRLGRVRRRAPDDDPPPVRDLLEVDAEYLERAMAGELRRIAPRRFNPKHVAWLPILHAMRGDRHYTAMFSNTAQAHRLHRTHDWVVIYVDGAKEEQFTAVTARTGDLRGLRVLRGRERECAGYYGIPHAGRGTRRMFTTPGKARYAPTVASRQPVGPGTVVRRDAASATLMS